MRFPCRAEIPARRVRSVPCPRGHRTMTDDALLQLFEDLSLPFAQWTHRAHVKVAYLYLRSHPFDEALVRIRRAIKAYNAANHVPDGPTSGYNETTTHAFLQLVAATMSAYDSVLTTDGADAVCDAHPQLMTRHVLPLYYSPERRMHPLAKTQVVEPDLAPLPLLRAHGAPAV